MIVFMQSRLRGSSASPWRYTLPVSLVSTLWRCTVTKQQKLECWAYYRRCWWTLFRNSKSGKRRRERRERRETKGERKGRKERKKVGIQKPIELRFWELIENKSNLKLVFSLNHLEGGCRREREFLPGSRDLPLVF